MPDERTQREQNRLSWNEATMAHQRHREREAAFLRGGGSTLFPEELELLGDVTGQSIVHLQCNTGRDTLSLATLGAQATGIDISDTAIDVARELSAETGIPARFVRMDVYDWLEDAAGAGERFDIAFCSYGAVCWLVDLDRWARGIAAILRPGGRFVVVDFHPVAGMFDDEWRLAYPYGGGRQMTAPEGVGDYVGDAAGGLTPAGFSTGTGQFENPYPCHLYQWGIGEIVTALAGAGFVITALKEYPFVNGERCFPGMQELPGRKMLPPGDIPALPLMYGIAARMPGR
jgi:SAM-dependent methyltransferase